MPQRFEKRESFRTAHEFWMISRTVCDVFRHVRPASAWRLESAAAQIVHLIIHSDRSLRRRPGQWRIGRALLAAAAAKAVLARLHKVEEQRVAVSAAAEVLERLTKALENEQEPICARFTRLAARGPF